MMGESWLLDWDWMIPCHRRGYCWLMGESWRLDWHWSVVGGIEMGIGVTNVDHSSLANRGDQVSIVEGIDAARLHQHKTHSKAKHDHLN